MSQLPLTEWSYWHQTPAASTVTQNDDEFQFTISNGGSGLNNVNHIQYWEIIPLTQENSYRIEFKIKASVNRYIDLALMD